MSDTIPAYQKIQQIYNKEVRDILKNHVWIEEKIDGSQFRIKVTKDGIDCGSHHQEVSMVDSMFKLATDMAEKHFRILSYTMERLNDTREFIVFCEYLKKPCHNALNYGRIPNDNLIIFDITCNGKYYNRTDKEIFAKSRELEVVPLLWEGPICDQNTLDQLLQLKSCLGGEQGIEGVVIKAYDTYYDVNEYPYLQGHFKCAKVVNPKFKEINKEVNLTSKNELEDLKKAVCTEARWQKAIQKGIEKGEVTNQMKDLKFIVPEVQKDLEIEEKENIKEILWKIYGKDIIRSSIRGLPEWYKEKLVEDLK